MTKYVMVTAISSYRIRYAIPVDELQKLNEDVPVDGHEIEWAEDSVTCQDAEEFSQLHIGESIIDSRIVDEQEMLQMFDAENDYLKSWTKAEKIEHVKDWKCHL